MVGFVGLSNAAVVCAWVGAGLPRERPVQLAERVLPERMIAGQARSYRSGSEPLGLTVPRSIG